MFHQPARKFFVGSVNHNIIYEICLTSNELRQPHFWQIVPFQQIRQRTGNFTAAQTWRCNPFCHIWDMVDKMRVFLFPIRTRNCLFSNRSIRSPSPGLPGSACHPASPYRCPCRRTVGPAGSAGCLVRPGPEFRVGFVCGFLRRNKNASGPIRRHKQIQDPYTQKDPPPFGNESF